MLQLSYPLILASASPRRKELLEMVCLPFSIVPSRYEEPLHADHLADPMSFVKELSFKKGEEVQQRTQQPSIILSADTIGLLGNLVLEKPRDREHAKEMLELLSGKTHTVITAFTLFWPEQESTTEAISTEVRFRRLDEAEIERYLDEEEYLDKAAAYAIQGKASVFVDHIAGDFFNVMGLPIAAVYQAIREKNL